MSDLPEFAQRYDDVTFEALRFISDRMKTEGLCRLHFIDDPTIVVWDGMSRLAAAIIADLINGGHLHLRPCESELYSIDAAVTNLPTSDGRSPGWFQCLLSADTWTDTDWRVEVAE